MQSKQKCDMHVRRVVILLKKAEEGGIQSKVAPASYREKGALWVT